VYALIGYSCTGKDTVLNALVQKGFKRVISHTSRPRRSKEQDHIDYHFVTYNEMVNMENNNEFIEMRKYDVASGETRLYGIHKDSIDLNSERDYICIVDCQGFEALQAHYGEENVIGIYLYVPGKERLLRALNRCELTEEDVDEIVRRYQADKVDFKQETIRKCSLYVENTDIKDTVEIILTYINYRKRI
jgi:guanylate kinase